MKYKHTREIVFNHLDKILDHPNVPQGSITALESLVTDITNSIECMKNLGRKSNLGEDIVVKLILKKMDSENRKEFKRSLPDTEVPSLDTLVKFINKVVADHATKMEVDAPATTQARAVPRLTTQNTEIKFSSAPQTSKRASRCSFCSEEHKTFQCKRLIETPAPERLNYVKEHKVCTNCLSPGHSTKECISKSTCKKCSKPHQTLLHKESPKPMEKNYNALTASASNNTHTILATAVVQLSNNYSQPWDCRALIDTGSTHTFITASLVNTLGLRRQELNQPMEVKGLSDVEMLTVTHQVELEVATSYSPDTLIRTSALIVRKASGVHPRTSINHTTWSHLQSLTLADPLFHKSRKVDIVFVADVYLRIIRGAIIRGREDEPMAQESAFGWMVLGPTVAPASNVSTCYNNSCPLDTSLSRFWEIEECPTSTRTFTKEEEECEEKFQATTSRNSDGSVQVELSFKSNNKPLGNSKRMALRRFYNLETKFEKQSTLRTQYTEQIHALLRDGHMHVVPKEEINLADHAGYYLPHHAVLKEASSTTKMRIVFDASARTTSGQSLNDQLMVGPVLQEDLFSILVRWRYWRVALTADIKQMYLYIGVTKEHQDFLRIFWRDHPSEPIQTYRLAKVTFGTSSAPFLAVKTLQTLANSHAQECPLAAAVIKRDFYV